MELNDEKSGYNLQLTFTPSGGTVIKLCAKSKQVPGYVGDDKLDVNTDCSHAAKEFEPGDQYEISDAKFTTIYNQEKMETLRNNLFLKGTLIITSIYTSKATTLDNFWINAIEPGSVDLNGNPTIDVTMSSGGGTAGEPVVSS
jgi:hypothetical protein